jgi:hypothetical protein
LCVAIGTPAALFLANGVERHFFRDDLDIEVMSESFVGVMFDILRRMLRSPTQPNCAIAGSRTAQRHARPHRGSLELRLSASTPSRSNT